MSTDARWMRLTLSLGARGLGRTWPNPAVGCVIVRDGRVVGRGWTQPGGRPHAEIEALAQAADLARGATAYVSLEPCAHVGKTGPCAKALIENGLSRVVIATGDPDPRVAGRGTAMLRDAGVTVTEGVLQDEANLAHRGFFSRVTHGRPTVTLKLASSLDGRIATGSGDSRWITGSAARRCVHMMRAAHDAVMVGSGTVLADDPDLRIRSLGTDHQPVRVVLDSRLRTPPDGRLAGSAKQNPVWILHGPNPGKTAVSALEQTGCQLLECGTTPLGLDLGAALQILGEQGLTRVLCEGGGQVAASLVSSGMVDRIEAFSAGVVVGAEGQPNFGALGLGRLSDAPRFELVNCRQMGGDVLTTWDKG